MEGRGDESEDVFGSEAKMYLHMLHFGEFMSLLGLALTIAGIFVTTGDTLAVIGEVILILGLLVLISGYLGYRDEMKKKGKKRVYTLPGMASIYVGGFSAIIIFGPWFSIPIGAIGMLLGVMGMKRGDNTYASAGVIAGAVGVFGGIGMWLLYYFSGIAGVV